MMVHVLPIEVSPGCATREEGWNMEGNRAVCRPCISIYCSKSQDTSSRHSRECRDGYACGACTYKYENIGAVARFATIQCRVWRTKSCQYSADYSRRQRSGLTGEARASLRGLAEMEEQSFPLRLQLAVVFHSAHMHIVQRSKLAGGGLSMRE